MPTIFALGGGELARRESDAIDSTISEGTGIDGERGEVASIDRTISEGTGIDGERGEVASIDRTIIEASESATAEVLFLPTASGDADRRIEAFESYFGDRLGCETDVLRLVDTPAIEAETAAQIGAADVIYVGGGQPGYLLETWRARGVDDLLREAWQRGTVLAGHSAGSLCWFAGGLSDAIGVRAAEYRPVSGLGFVPGLHVTPRATPDRRAAFGRYLAVRGATGVALEPDTAIEINDSRWRIHASAPDAAAHLVRPADDETVIEDLPADGSYRPLSHLRGGLDR